MWLWGTIERGFKPEQLYSTASYQVKDLRRIKFFNDNLSGWDFTSQDLTGSAFSFCDLTNTNFAGANLQSVSFSNATIKDADFSGADLRHVQSLPVTTYRARNTIGIGGQLHSPELLSGEALTVHDDDGYTGENMYLSEDPRPVEVFGRMTVSTRGTLRLVLEDDAWDSTISFQPNIPVELGGSLELAFAAGVDPAAQIGRTFKLFDWTGVNPTGQFDVVSDYPWDTANLYSAGEVTLIPEPATLASAVTAAILVLLATIARQRRTGRHRSSQRPL